jgi:hypothetical protein
MLKPSFEAPKAPIGFFKSLWKGVEAVNSHLWLLVIPVVLDLFLWLGPRVSVAGVLYPWVAMMETALRSVQSDASFLVPLRQFVADFNLFKLLANLPLFPPSVMADRMPTQSPLGVPTSIQVQDPLVALVFAAALVAGSLVLGALYWAIAGESLADRRRNARDFVRRVAQTAVAVLALILLFALIMVSGVFLSLVVSGLIGLFWLEGSLFLLQLFVFGFIGLLFWATLFFVFAPHGTVLFQDGIGRAIWNSVETSRWIYPLSMWIPILYLILNMFALQVWALPDQTDWLCLLGVLGNAYTGSVLVMASLVYYQDKRRWIDEVRTLIQSQRAATVPPATSA